MVTRFSSPFARQRGALMAELVVAMALLIIAVLPIAYSITSEKRLARTDYEHAIAMEIVDGEMEVLLAGGWHQLAQGTHEYAVHDGAMTNLPPGQFLVTVEPTKVRLEWKPAARHHGGPVAREAMVK